MEKQRIYFNDENKLVIETDNCKNIDGELHTQVEGDFCVDAKDVVKLFSIVNKKNCLYSTHCRMDELFWCRPFNIFADELYIIDDKLADIIKNQKDNIVKLSNELTKLGNKITEFNDTRHWWERKIKVD